MPHRAVKASSWPGTYAVLVTSDSKFLRRLSAGLAVGGASWTEYGAGLKRFQLSGPMVLDLHRPGVVRGGTASGLAIEIELP